MTGEEENVKTTRRNFIVGTIGGLVGLILGVAIGSQASPRKILETTTETRTVTSVSTITVTETVTQSATATETSIPTQTATPLIPEELKQKFQALLPNASKFYPVMKNDVVLYYRAYSSDNKLVGYSFETKVYAPTDRFLVYVAVDPSFKIVAIDVEQAPDSITMMNPRILTSDFENQFIGLSANDLALSPEGKIDAVTGATISSGAIYDNLY
jgi:Na+-translocating ferredoxin:NAD+ oxidoreductase RnfG subunit